MSIKQFTSRIETIPFEVNGVHFEAAGTLPADDFIDFLAVVGDLGKLGQQAKERSDSEEEGGSFDIETLRRQKELMARAVSLALLPESVEAFHDAMKDRARPLSLDLLTEALMWLMEEYKLSKADDDADEEDDDAARPTQPSSDSATGSSPTEDSSEDD
jgi:hypothetical protein